MHYCLSQVKTIRLVGILLLVFVEKKHLPHVSEVDASTVATGIMGLMVRSVVSVVVLPLLLPICLCDNYTN